MTDPLEIIDTHRKPGSYIQVFVLNSQLVHDHQLVFSVESGKINTGSDQP